MPFGTAVLSLKSFAKTGNPDALGNYELTPTTVSAPGCRHRPLTFKETAELQFDVATEYWRTTIPLCEYATDLVTTLKAIKNNAVIDVNGQEYQIIGGVRPFDDLEGHAFKMTIHSQKHVS